MNDSNFHNNFNDSGDSRFREFTSLFRKILYFANQGVTRLSFLREVSGMLIRFSCCDSVELWLNDEDLSYYWTAYLNKDDTLDYKIINLKTDIHKLPRSSNTSKYKLNQYCQDILSGVITPQSKEFPQKGILFKEIIEKNSCKDIHLNEGIVSAALLPFYVGDNQIGLLILKSKQKDFFNFNNIDFYEGMAQTLGIAVSNRRAQAALKERIKEIKCMYGICQTYNLPGLTLKSVLRRVAGLLPPAMQHPEIASARIMLDGISYKSPGFKSKGEKLSADIIINNRKRGVIEVVYEEKVHELGIEPFLREEKNLLVSVARNVALIVERKKAEEAKTKLESQLRHADRLATLGQIAAGVAHELNEPLGNILGFAQLAVKNEDIPSQTAHDLDKIINASLYAREIVKKLLIFARQMPVKIIPLRLNPLIEDVLSFFAARFVKEKIQVKLLLAEDLPDIPADISQIRQVLVNLIVNAMQAMPQGGVLSVSTLNKGSEISLVIEDTGVGMSKKVLKQIFIPFYTTKDVGQGTGLGLPVVHGIVSAHGGIISVMSKAGGGSRFEVVLPVNKKRSGGENGKTKGL